jgi:predicted helicase
MRWICYDEDIVDWPRTETMAHFNDGENVALLTPRMTADDFSPLVSDAKISNKTASRYDQSYFFPLYIYPTEKDLDRTRRVNFDPKLYKRLQSRASQSERGTPDELAVLDYIYGVLHCPAYRASATLHCSDRSAQREPD